MDSRPAPGAREQRPVGVLRPLMHDDLDALMPVQQEGAVVGLGHIFPQDQHPFPTAAIRARWAEEIADAVTRCYAVVDADGSLAGFAATRGAQLLHVGTAVGTWGTGRAGRAHDAVLEELRTAGLTTTWLRVFEDNHRARRFSERRGWSPTGDITRSPFPPRPRLLGYRRELTTEG